MRKALMLLASLLSTINIMAQSDSLYKQSFTDIEGKEVGLKKFRGKKIMFVNVASECGFTGQYSELQELHEKHGNKVVLIGFPCDQFGGQEPGTEKEIQAFCQKNYGVTFLMASKVEVKGEGQHPIYKWLTSENMNGKEESEIRWNFEKFIVDEKGNLIGHFRSQTKPMSEKIIELL